MVSPLLGCGDDGTGATTETDPAPTLSPSQGSTSEALTGTTNPSGTPTEDTGGGNSLGTESDGTTGPSPTTTDPTATTAPVTTDTTTGSTSDPSSTTDPDPDTGSTGEPPPPPCIESDCVNMGEYCNPDTGKCEPGCNDDADCGGMTVCDSDNNVCTGCLVDANCGLGTVCENNTCVPGCTDVQPCAQGLACCGGQCFDLLTDIDHCGGCDACPPLQNADSACNNGVCEFSACAANFNDCDKDPNNGCETDDACECTPNSALPCYTGPDNTAGIGVCKLGMQICNAQGTGYSGCMGEVPPAAEDMCGNMLDDDCNNVVDDNPDADGDGYNKCNGDCCDSVGPACLNPNLVNPGAFEVGGNMVDDDCDGIKDNVLGACDAGLASNSAIANDYAKAIDLCQFTVENPPQDMKKWGVISTALLQANDAAHNFTEARSIRSGFGTGGITRQKNSNMAVLSTGNAADQNDINPPYVAFQGSQNAAPNSAAPAVWLAANGGQFPNAPGCPVAGSTTAFDGINLRIRIRVPTNALSFNVQMHFMSSEWPEWVCSNYNDMFITLVQSGANTNPPDKNIAIYTTPQLQKYPVGVNIAKAAPGLFTECENGTIACLGNNQGAYNNCSAGPNPLAGTGMGYLAQAGCGNNDTTGGGTGWLKLAGNVVPGEVMEIRFIIWDTGDQNLDSLVFLDAWEWSLQASQPGVTPN